MKAGMTGVSMTFNAVLELYAGKLARTVPRGAAFPRGNVATQLSKCLRSLSDSFAAAPADRFMHAPQLKKWTAIIDHHCVIGRLACNPDLNLAVEPASTIRVLSA
jgi:hypothetical protein